MGRKDNLKLARNELYIKSNDEDQKLSNDDLEADLEYDNKCQEEYDIESAYIIQEALLKYVNDCVGNTMCEYLYISNIEQFIQYLHKK